MRKAFLKLLAPAIALMLCLTCCASGDIEPWKTITDYEIGEYDGYSYELWKDSGDTTMSIYEDGVFECEWENINNALFRTGRKYDCTQTWQEIGNIQIEYDVDYRPDGNSYLALYGWTREPLVEYYIVESWGNWRLPGGVPTATITVDGALYDIYETTRYNAPSIDGNTTFQQYWAVRQEKSSSGTIKVGDVFTAWESLGMKLGKFYEASLTVEGYQSKGYARVNKNEITISDSVPEIPKGAGPMEPDENGVYEEAVFEQSEDSWQARGDCSVELSSAAAKSGDSSLLVKGRRESWNGAGRSLAASTFKPGEVFSFSVFAMQDSVDEEIFKLTLQYTANGQTDYAGIAEVTASRGEWAELSNASFVIPDGASGLLLYVETDSGTNSFYIDDAKIAVGEEPSGEQTDSQAEGDA